MDLPLLLAGPILRRVEPTLVSVWVALSRFATVRLLVWEGRAAATQGNPMVSSPGIGATPVRVGAELYIAQVTLRIPPESVQSFQADRLYSYDVEFDLGDSVETLNTLNMLGAATVDGVAHVPLGYEPGLLPSFAPPPSDLENLRLLYGSCRRPSHPDPDAMVWIDDLIFDDAAYQDPRRRPHQLFLGGDQIYADDVQPLHMLLVMRLANQLIGTSGADPNAQSPVEHLRLDEILSLKPGSTPSTAAPLDSYQLEPAATTAADPELPADRIHFPEARRLSLTRRAAQLTSEDGSSHVMSLGEFAALYLSVWSSACWGPVIPEARLVLDPNDPNARRAILWDEDLPAGLAIEMPAVRFPARIARHFYPEPGTHDEPDTRTPEEIQRSLRGDLAILKAFRKGLPKVQRALANVPTYMVLDDHDVTDDFFLNPMWRDRVLTTALGQDILRNGLLAYALFQDWGNDPVSYDSGPQRELLDEVPKLFAEDVLRGPNRAAAERINQLFGLDLRNTPTADGRFDSVTPPILWHFSVDGPKHRVIAIDNRTRRSYGSRNGPPGNVSIEAQVDQVPAQPLPAGREVLIVIAPLQVIGPPVLDEIVAPLTYRVFDAVQAAKKESELHPDSTTGLREMLGTNPDAIEAWAFDTITFEALLKRLQPFQRVVLLSGDVHYSSGALMSYWLGNATQPARIAQFTSSGFKNVMPGKISRVDRSAGWAQQMVRAKVGTERIGWDRPQEQLVLLPAGTSELDLVPVMRSRLQSVPVMVPSFGWPDQNDYEAPDFVFDPLKASRLNPAFPPDWRWRVTPLVDTRADSERPAPIQPLPLDNTKIEQQLASPATVLQAYQAIAARHQHVLGHLRNARMMLFRANFGLVRFERKDGGKLDAIHEVYTAFADPDQPAAEQPKAQAYMVQVAPLGPEDEAPPSTLRAPVIPVPLPKPPAPALAPVQQP